MKKLFAAIAALSALAMTVTAAYAYQVAPMIYDLKPSGSGASAIIRVQNDSAKPITIELVAEKRSFDENGKESRAPADDDFVLFPPQAVVPAGQTQAIRVQYVGPADIKASVMYTVTVKQVPVDLPIAGPSGVQFVFNFSTLANIVPDGAKAAVGVISTTPDADGVALRLRNTGNKYANLALSRVIFGDGAKAIVLEGETWRKMLGASWLLPGTERVIHIPKSANVTAGSSARFELLETNKSS